LLIQRMMFLIFMIIFFIVYDKKEEKIYKDVIITNGKWCRNQEDGFMIKIVNLPQVQFEIVKSGYTLLLKEKVKNGNSYYAMVTHFIDINRINKSVTKKYSFESSVISTIEDWKIQRYQNADTIKTYVVSDGVSEYVGFSIIDFKLMRIKNKQVLKEFYPEEWLFTNSNLDDNVFLNEGYKFRY
jgi:hypothetical protein